MHTDTYISVSTNMYGLINMYIRTYTHTNEYTLTHTHTHTYIYIYVVLSRSFLIFYTAMENCRRFLKIQFIIAIHLMRWLNDFYDFRFKWTATAGIATHPTKSWEPQLVNIKTAIWTWGHIRRTICHKILF